LTTGSIVAALVVIVSLVSALTGADFCYLTKVGLSPLNFKPIDAASYLSSSSVGS
jgi:hypothetical protein